MPWLAWTGRSAAASCPATAAAMRAARDNETAVYYTYAEFGRQAAREGYLGVAYLFTAVAASEMVHATNFARLLARLNVEAPPAPKPRVKVGSTRDNLIAAARGELDSIESFYPKLLQKISAEGMQDAIDSVRWAWESEKQHREKMQQIVRWSPLFFEQVARTIDKKTGQYFVCQICGSTTNAVPAETCPVCRQAAMHYRLIDPPDA